jgi:hypothetical protein
MSQCQKPAQQHQLLPAAAEKLLQPYAQDKLERLHQPTNLTAASTAKVIVFE